MASAPKAESPTNMQAALAASPLFRGLSAPGLKRLAAAGTVVSLAPRALLCSRGDESDAMFIVAEGEVEIRAASEGGKEVRITALGQGAVVGEMGVLDGGPRSADMAATRRTKLLRIPRAAVLDALTDEPRALLVLVAEIVGRLRRGGSRGLVYPSVRAPGGNCLVCFEPGAVQNVRPGASWDLAWEGTPDYSIVAVA